MPELMSTMPVLLAVAGALIATLLTRRRLVEWVGRRLDRIEGRLAGLDSALRRIEESLADRGEAGPPSSIGIRRGDRPHHSSPSRPRSVGRGTPAPGEDLTPAPAPTLIAVPDLSGAGRAVGSQAEAAGRATASGDLARRFGRIWEMADEGGTADRIASATGHPIGQVELVLNLRRRLIDGPDDRADRRDEVPG
ncbi:hypothetical protein [Tautonia plasticadhaerens]|uniref:Uncharacterized protein n=1 Tax=Tautonia plasticadhaerens TaxID=2527974 RepID=A0A518GZE2_9BACT|nr:hypothetical protein [Tautonia plasticadhaerens]QDV33950.1 hypothetical protein ElP_18310 [Tautonia plasticadhaerens]